MNQKTSQHFRPNPLLTKVKLREETESLTYSTRSNKINNECVCVGAQSTLALPLGVVCCHTKSMPDLGLWRRSHVRSTSFFTSDTMKTVDVRATRKARSGNSLSLLDRRQTNQCILNI